LSEGSLTSLGFEILSYHIFLPEKAERKHSSTRHLAAPTFQKLPGTVGKDAHITYFLWVSSLSQLTQHQWDMVLPQGWEWRGGEEDKAVPQEVPSLFLREPLCGHGHVETKGYLNHACFLQVLQGCMSEAFSD
jgi:hypothetical protein